MVLAVSLVTLWGMFLMFFGIVIFRLVSKVRVNITLDDHDLESLGSGEEITVITNSVTTKMSYKERAP